MGLKLGAAMDARTARPNTAHCFCCVLVDRMIAEERAPLHPAAQHRKISPADLKTFNKQYPKLAIRYNETFHDRFLIIDDKEIYLINATKKRAMRFVGEIRRRRTRGRSSVRARC